MNRETAEAYVLGGVGLVKGLCEVVRELPAGDKAWVALMGSVAVYEAYAPSGELLSESTDRMIDKHPIATRLAIGYTALHLCNALPEKLDIFHQISNIKSR